MRPVTRFSIELDERVLEIARAAAAGAGLTIPAYVSRLVTATLLQGTTASSPAGLARLVAAHVAAAAPTTPRARRLPGRATTRKAVHHVSAWDGREGLTTVGSQAERESPRGG